MKKHGFFTPSSVPYCQFSSSLVVQSEMDLSSYLPQTLCAHHWDQIILTKSRMGDKGPKSNLKESLKFEEALAELSSSLSLFAQLELASKLSSRQGTTSFSPEKYFEALGLKNMDLIQRISTLLKKLPESFILWAKEKDLKARDCLVFLNFYRADQDKDFLIFITSQLSCSKSLGKEILEHYFDFKSRSQNLEPDMQKLLSFSRSESLLNFMKSNKYSASESLDKKIQQQIEELKLARGESLSILREGDKRKIIYQSKSGSPKELLKQLQALEPQLDGLAQKWEQNFNDFF